MKLSSTQLFNATISLLSGALADPNMSWPVMDKNIEQFIDIAKRTAALIPETNVIPTDDEIKEACQQLVEKDKPINASVLGYMLANRFGIQITVAYTLIQKAVILGYVIPTRDGKKTTYTLA